MSDVTICQSAGGQPLSVDSLSDREGCLIRIYPTEGRNGMWNLGQKEVHLGRGVECDVQLDDEAASRKHAVIQSDEEGYFLVDLSSTNGTYVNNSQVTRHRLVAGDCVRIGTHLLKYLSADHVEFQYHETVFRMTTRDGLTQAFNRQYCSEFLEREIERGAAHKHPVTLAMLDIDHFKEVNDTHGHLVGDEVLRELCERVQTVLHGGDLFGRFGGEEFAAVLCVCGGEEAKQLGEQIREIIEHTMFITPVAALSITISIGMTTWNCEGQQPTVEELLAVADDNLYRAKESGRNRVVWSKFEKAIAQ